jgi:hypothetical protein
MLITFSPPPLFLAQSQKKQKNKRERNKKKGGENKLYMGFIVCDVSYCTTSALGVGDDDDSKASRLLRCPAM